MIEKLLKWTYIKKIWSKLKTSLYWSRRNGSTSNRNMIKALDSNHVCGVHHHMVSAKRKRSIGLGPPLAQPMHECIPISAEEISRIMAAHGEVNAGGWKAVHVVEENAVEEKGPTVI